MRSHLKNRVNSLIAGSEKGNILAVTNPETGIYYFRDTKLSQIDLNELKKKYEKCVILKPKIYY